MKVRALIQALSSLPPEEEIYYFDNGDMEGYNEPKIITRNRKFAEQKRHVNLIVGGKRV